MLDRRWLHNLAFGVVLALFLGAVGMMVLSLVQQQPSGPTQHNQEAQSGQGTTGPNTAAVDINRPQSSGTPTGTTDSQQPCNSDADCRQKDLIAQQRMADATDRMAGLAIQQFWATVGEVVLLLLTVGAASVAIFIALGANKIARESAERQLRAYVLLAKPHVTFDQDGRVIAEVPLKNTGQSPAHSVRTWTHIAVAPLSWQNKLPTTQADPERSSVGFIASGGQVTIDIDLANPVGEAERNEVVNRRWAVFIYGFVNYADIFEKPQTTNFRMMYQGDWDGTKNLSFCTEGNDAT